MDACGHQQGLHEVVRVIPADRFWALQAMETALFLGLALALVAFAFWWVRRRIG
jgi:flagellar biogenesis protein FliO